MLSDLVPHQGAMCLLGGVLDWSERHILAWADSHLDPGNPLRRGGRLAAVCGAEYGMQAAALHGGLVQGGRQGAGRVVGLRLETIGIERLDDPSLPRLEVEARREHGDGGGQIYWFAVRGGGRLLLAGSSTIMLGAA